MATLLELQREQEQTAAALAEADRIVAGLTPSERRAIVERAAELAGDPEPARGLAASGLCKTDDPDIADALIVALTAPLTVAGSPWELAAAVCRLHPRP